MKQKSDGFINFLRSILPMVTAIGVQFAVIFAVQLVLIIYLSVSNIELAQIAAENGDQEAYLDAVIMGYAAIAQAPLFNDILTLATMLLLALVFGIWFFKSEYPKSMSPVREALIPRNIGLIMIAGVLGQICVSMLLVIILPLFPRIFAQYQQLMDSLVGGNVVISLVSTVLLAPFAEELIFRGLTLGATRKFLPYIGANTVQALFFGIYHMNIVQGVYAFAMGMVFGYVAYKLNNIFASILFHASINGSSFLLEFIMPEALYTNTIGMLLVSLISAIAIWALLYLLKAPKQPGKPSVNSPAGPVLQTNNNL